MKTLSIHEKINLRAWFARIVTGQVPMKIRVALPMAELPRLAYAITGRAASTLAVEQPPLVRQKPRMLRPSDLNRFSRYRKHVLGHGA